MADRRSFLRGLAAVPLAAAPLAALPAHAAPSMSTEAAALLAEFHDIASRYNAVCNRLDAATTATARIPEPEELFGRRGDSWVLRGRMPVRHWNGKRSWYGEHATVEQLRAEPFRDVDGTPDISAQARRDEIVGAWDRWRVDEKAARDASGETEASCHYQTVGEEHDAFVRRLVLMRTADPDIMKVKAALVRNAWVEVDRFDHALTRVMEDSEEIEDALSVSLMRDVMHQLSDEFRVTT